MQTSGGGWVAIPPPPPPPGANDPTVNARPQGQSGFAYETAQPGDNGPNSGPADSAVNTHTTGTMNPADLGTLNPYEPDMDTDAGPGTPGPLPPAQTQQLDDAQCGGGLLRYDGEAWSRTAVACEFATAGATGSAGASRFGFTSDLTTLYHGTTPERAASIRAEGIDLSRANVNTDFGPGFYTTRTYSQAFARAKSNAAGILIYKVPTSSLEGLSGIRFVAGDDAYVVFTRGIRAGNMHAFDWAEGPFIRNPKPFYAGKPLKAEGGQISFHTAEGVDLLNRGLR